MSSVVSGYVNADKGIAATPSAHRTEEAVRTIYEIAPKERRAEYIAYVASSAVAQQHTPEQAREAVSRVFNAIKETVPFDDQARYLKTAAQAQVQATAKHLTPSFENNLPPPRVHTSNLSSNSKSEPAEQTMLHR